MATSKSVKKAAQWIGGALVFSGRPDPTWTVPDQTARELESHWAGLQPAMGSLPVPPGLVTGVGFSAMQAAGNGSLMEKS
jgi:hypothetical protein